MYTRLNRERKDDYTMLKKITALLLITALLVACFGCGGKTNVELTSDFKIAIITGSKELNPDTYAKAAELAEIYGENLIVKEYADDYVDDAESVYRASFKTANADGVKAMIFANGTEGTLLAIDKIRVNRGGMFVAVCGASEGYVALSERADLILNVDFNAAAESMIKTAAELGADNFVFYTFRRHTEYALVDSMRKAAAEAATANGVKLTEVGSVDIFEKGRTLDSAKSFISEDTARKSNSLGTSFAMYSTDPYVQETLVRESLRRNAIVAAPYSPFVLARALDVDLTGHETDAEYAIEQNAQKLNGTDDAGRAASWTFSPDMLMLQAAFEYAYISVNAGDKEVDTAAELNKIAKKLSGDASFAVNDEFSKVYELSGAFHKY